MTPRRQRNIAVQYKTSRATVARVYRRQVKSRLALQVTKCISIHSSSVSAKESEPSTHICQIVGEESASVLQAQSSVGVESAVVEFRRVSRRLSCNEQVHTSV